MDNIIGHNSTKKQIQIAVESAKHRNKGAPHMLFSGVSGCGKTTMASEMAKLSDVDFISVPPSELTDRKDVLAILDKLSHVGYDKYGNRTGKTRPTILFLDEIHQIPKRGQEVLGIAMEKFMLETGKANKFYWIPYFTLIGATTDDGHLTKPFREKFKLRLLFETYPIDDMIEVTKLHAYKKKIIITNQAVKLIAARSRGVPRIAVKYLEQSRDYANHIGADIITSKPTRDNFKIMGVDSEGLTKTEIGILLTLHKAEQPIGLDNLAIISNESVKNIKDVAEPFLIQKGLILRSGKGRIITSDGIKHLEKGGYLESTYSKSEIPADYKRK